MPIANLVVPLRVTAEQWRASAAPQPGAWQTQPVSGVVFAWWFALLAMGISRWVYLFALLEFAAVSSTDEFGGFGLLRGLIARDVIQNGVGLVGASLALVLVSRVSGGLLCERPA